MTNEGRACDMYAPFSSFYVCVSFVYETKLFVFS